VFFYAAKRIKHLARQGTYLRSTLFISSAVIFVSSFVITKLLYAAPGSITVLSDQEVDARLNYTVQTLYSQETHAEYWEYGWGAFDSSTMIWSAVQASQDHSRKSRNTDIVQATESLAGLADLTFRPLPAFNAGSVCEETANAEQSRLQCLAAREALLERSAQRADGPYEMLSHLGNFGFNLFAGLVVWRAADTRHALTTAIPGEIIGEIQLWTVPRQPVLDFDRYKAQFSPLLLQSGRSRSPITGVMFTFGF